MKPAPASTEKLKRMMQAFLQGYLSSRPPAELIDRAQLEKHVRSALSDSLGSVGMDVQLEVLPQLEGAAQAAARLDGTFDPGAVTIAGKAFLRKPVETVTISFEVQAAPGQTE